MIQREERDWGVRLLVRPFSVAKYAPMEIQVDIHKPHGKRVFVRFSGTTETLRFSDARIWQSAYSAILAEAEKVAQELAPKKKARTKR